MILDKADAATIAAGGRADVAIIGAGPAGLAIAHRLLPLGLRVVVLEAGGSHFDRKAQDDAFDGVVEPAMHPPLALYRRRMLGGTSTVWGGRCIPFDASDFEDTKLGDGASWPIGQGDVAPYLAQALSWLDAGAPEFTAAQALPGSPAPLIEDVGDPRLSLDEVERFSLPLNVWHKYADEFRDAKSALIAPGCVCTNIIADPAAPRAHLLRIRTTNGAQANLEAKIIVLAAGGLETPRLLLASREGRAQGLGNSHDLVGRFYMTHILADVGSLSVRNPQRVHLDYALSRDGVYVRRLLKLSDAARRERGLLNAIVRPNIPPIGDAAHNSSVLSAAYLAKRLIIPEYRRRLVAEGMPASSAIRHAVNVLSGIPGLVAFGIDWSRRRTIARRKLPSLFLNRGKSFSLEVAAEHAPHRESRIALGRGSDRNGMPRLTADWRLSADDTASLRATLETMRDALDASPNARLEFSRDALDNIAAACRPQGGHHIGTARMGADNRTGVVNGWGALWEAENVYLAGSAIFPRSSVANPTLTSVALAFRTADRIINELSGRVANV